MAALGYKEVEFAGYFDKTPQQVKAALERHGLTAPSTHIGYDQLGEQIPKVIEASTIIGHQFIVNPWIDEAVRNQPGAWKRAAETFNTRRRAEQEGRHPVRLSQPSFRVRPVDGGKRPLDLILETCDPKLVKIELDLCWAAAAGQDPVAWFDKYPGRFPMVHVKGLKKLPPDAAKWTVAPPIETLLPDVADVGPGAIDWARIFAHAQTAGIQHYFVEHDQPKAPFESLAASAKYLQGLRF